MEGEEQETLNTPGVLEKYQTAAKIANTVLEKLLKKVSVGSKVIELCSYADHKIYQQLDKVYNKKSVFKGLAFPTTLSINEICAYNAPLPEDSSVIQEGDMVKVELGVHIDGFPALVAHTLIVQSNMAAPVVGEKAAVVLAAYKSAQAALRLIRPGHINNEVTQVIQSICDDYHVNPVEGVLSHELKKHLIDGNKVIINKQNFDQKVDKCQFAVHDVFALDVFVSSGEGKPKEADCRCTVFKRAIERSYNLKIKQSRQFFNDVLTRYPTFCFSLNAFEDEVNTKIGIKECIQHELLVPYPVLTEKPGSWVAQFKFTVIVGKSKTTALTGLPINEEIYQCQYAVKNERAIALLNMSLDKSEQKKQRRAEEGKKKEEHVEAQKKEEVKKNQQSV